MKYYYAALIALWGLICFAWGYTAPHSAQAPPRAQNTQGACAHIGHGRSICDPEARPGPYAIMRIKVYHRVRLPDGRYLYCECDGKELEGNRWLHENPKQ